MAEYHQQSHYALRFKNHSIPGGSLTFDHWNTAQSRTMRRDKRARDFSVYRQSKALSTEHNNLIIWWGCRLTTIFVLMFPQYYHTMALSVREKTINISRLLCVQENQCIFTAYTISRIRNRQEEKNKFTTALYTGNLSMAY